MIQYHRKYVNIINYVWGIVINSESSVYDVDESQEMKCLNLPEVHAACKCRGAILKTNLFDFASRKWNANTLYPG